MSAAKHTPGVLAAIHADMNSRHQYDQMAYDSATYLIDQAIALDEEAMDAIAEEVDMPCALGKNLVRDLLTALHLAAPCAANTDTERLDALVYRLRKALEPAAEAVVRAVA